MKKGDIIWIKKNDGSIFCSEFDHLTYQSNGTTRCAMQLIPIIGNCINLFMWNEVLECDWNLRAFVVSAIFNKGSYHISEYVSATLNLDNLFP